MFPIELRTGGALLQIWQMVAGNFDLISSNPFAIAARDKWRVAWRTRELASALPLDRDRETLTAYAEELEGEAQALERQAAATNSAAAPGSPRRH